MQKRKWNKFATSKTLRFHCDIVGKEDTQPTNIRCFTCSLSDRFFLLQIKQKPTKLFTNWLKTQHRTKNIICPFLNILYQVISIIFYLLRFFLLDAKNISIFMFGQTLTLYFFVNILFSDHLIIEEKMIRKHYSHTMIYLVRTRAS